MADRTEKWEPMVSIVIPAYNEEARIGPSLTALAKFCENHFMQYEIICVDDGSTDATRATLRANEDIPFVRPLRLPTNRGKGFAVKHGMLNARGDFRFFTDADLPYRLDAFNTALEAFRTKCCDMVAGDRGLADASEGIKTGMVRRFVGRIFSAIANLLVKTELSDSQCGLKGFTAGAAAQIFSNLHICGYVFDVEIFFLARRHQLKVCRIPVALVRQSGSKIRLCRDSFVMLADLVKLARRYKV